MLAKFLPDVPTILLKLCLYTDDGTRLIRLKLAKSLAVSKTVIIIYLYYYCSVALNKIKCLHNYVILLLRLIFEDN